MRYSKTYWLNLARFTLIVVLVAAVGMTLYLSYSRAMNLVHPVRWQTALTPTDMGITTWEDISFPSADGLQLSGWFIPPDPRGEKATLIFVHGLGTNREHLLDQAALLRAYGYGALLLDLRNHGASQGTLTTFGYAEVEDVRGAVQYLLTRAEVNPQRIGLVGHSMGGGTVIRAAARIPQVRAVIAQSAYTSLEDNLADGFRVLTGLPPFPFAPLMIWFGERETGMNIQQVRPIDDVPRIAPRALLLIHGERDALVPASNSVRLFQAAGEPKRLYLIPNAGHNDLSAANPKEFERQVVEFLETYLGK